MPICLGLGGRTSRTVFAAALFAVALPAFSNAQTVQWARQFGTTRVEEPLAVATGPNSVYTAGYTLGAFPGSANAGNRDVFVSKYDTAGNAVWTRQFGTSEHDVATGLAADASGVYLVGRTDAALLGQTNLGSTDAFVRKYDPNGNELWTRQFGTSALDQAFGAAVDATGFYVVGGTVGALPGQTSLGGSEDAFIRKYDPNGNELWTRQFGTIDGDRAHGVAADSSGVYVAGYTTGALVSAAAGTDGFVRKYDANGTVVWTRQITSQGSQADIAYAVAVHSSGVYVTGDTVATFAGQTNAGGPYDAWVRKYDLNGGEQWTRQFGTVNNDSGYGIAVFQRWVYVAVNSSSWRLTLQRFDLDGNATGTLENPLDRNFGNAVAADASGAYLAASKDGPSLGQTPLGDLDSLLVKIPHPPILSGVSDAFTGQVGVSSTTWIALYGENIASAVKTWDTSIQGRQLPSSIDGVSVSINGRPATIYFISPTQINVLAPLDDTSGNVQVIVTNPAGTSPALQVRKAPYLPAFYAPFGETKGLSVTAVALDGTLLGKPTLDPRVARPVRPGEVVQFFATGFGATNPPVQSDQIFLGAPEVATPPRITIGGSQASLLGAGNLVGPGLYQFNLTIPDVADGDQPIVAEIGGVRSSSTVFLAVRK